MGSNQSAGHTILVVEDTADTRELLCIWLRSRGYTVVEAGDGPEAVEVARRERPDLVMMDISLPTFDGLTATQYIRQIEGISDIPVVACSAHSAREWADLARGAGCDEFISKPVDFAVIEMALKRLLPQHH